VRFAAKNPVLARVAQRIRGRARSKLRWDWSFPSPAILLYGTAFGPCLNDWTGSHYTWSVQVSTTALTTVTLVPQMWMSPNRAIRVPGSSVVRSLFRHRLSTWPGAFRKRSRKPRCPLLAEL